MAYAKGTKALGECDRCGFSYLLNELKYEVQNETKNGLRVCSSCLDPDNPQYQLGRNVVADPQALFDPRPDRGDFRSLYTVAVFTQPIESKVGSVTVTTS